MFRIFSCFLPVALAATLTLSGCVSSGRSGPVWNAAREATRSARTSGTIDAEQEIRALIARYGAAANARDLQAVMRTYATSDAMLVFDVSNAPFRGVAEVRRDWEDFFTAMRAIDLAFRNIEVTVDTGGAFGYATFMERASLTPAQGGAPFVNDNLRTTQIYKKIDGQWLIVHEHKSKSRTD